MLQLVIHHMTRAIFPSNSATSRRIEGLDTARGVAIALMILSHTVKALLPFKMMPFWGVAYVHAVTKFSSTLFIIVFGLSLSVAYLPKVGTPDWPRLRWRLWRRAVTIMVWYKLLIVVQMFERSKPKAIIDTLLFKKFPDFVEILQFYAWFVLLLPLLLPLWKPLPQLFKAFVVAGLVFAAQWLRGNFDFWDVWQLQAVLVEREGNFCFGLLSRGAMVLGAMLVGEIFLSDKRNERRAQHLGMFALLAGGTLMAVFVSQHAQQLTRALLRLAHNQGKHPPTLNFVLWSTGGALLILAFVLLFSRFSKHALRPMTIIGRESLYAFNFHIVFIWLFYRYYLGLRQQVTYMEALQLTLGVVVAAVITSALWSALKAARKMKRDSHWRTGDDTPIGSRAGRMNSRHSLTAAEAAIADQFDARTVRLGTLRSAH